MLSLYNLCCWVGLLCAIHSVHVIHCVQDNAVWNVVKDLAIAVV